MQRIFFIAFAVLIGLPRFAQACIPHDPYDYPIRGAYLVVLLSAVIAFSLELFRLLARKETLRRGLRFTAYGFALLLLLGLLTACILRAYEASWERNLPAEGVPTLRC